MKRIALLAVLAIILTSCGAGKAIMNTAYVRDTTYIRNVQVDSVFHRDSIFVREKNDTVYQYVERIRDRYKFVHDTVYRYKIDSVFVDRINEVQIEKPLTAWQRFKMKGFWWLLAVVAGYLCWSLRKPLLTALKKLLSLLA